MTQRRAQRNGNARSDDQPEPAAKEANVIRRRKRKMAGEESESEADADEDIGMSTLPSAKTTQSGRESRAPASWT